MPSFHLEAIEAHYRRSAFIAEIGVFASSGSDASGSPPLHALVVPDLTRMRERRIVNVGDLLRFEMEGLSAALPPPSRVATYEISFEPLPRDAAGALDRAAVQQAAADAAQCRAGQALTDVDRVWLADPHVSAVVAMMPARVAGAIAPDANLEIDLGLDSMERVELITGLEQRFGVQVRQDAQCEIFTVRQLVEAVRPGPSNIAPGEPEAVWTRLLRAQPIASALAQDPGLPPSLVGRFGELWRTGETQDLALQPLLERRLFLTPLVFAASRAVRLFANIRATGLEQLPRNAVFILAPNHQSYLDPFLIASVLPYRVFRRLFFLGATEYFETALTRRLARAFNIVPADPDANLVGAMRAGAFGLRHGKVLLVFPEGERSIDGDVKRFKKGATVLSAHLDAPIVPVAIDGAFDLWPRNQPIDWRRFGFWNRHRVTIRFGAPMRTDRSADYGVETRWLRDTVDAMWRP